MLNKKYQKKSIAGLTEYTEKMVAALAHEIRNPLNSMKGAAEYLNKKYRETDEIKEFSGIILNEINHVELYLNEFLSFSRGMKLKVKQVNLKNYITGIIMTVKHSFPYEIETDTKKADVNIEIDGEQVRQALVNLLTNAKDAVARKIPEKPRVFIKAVIKSNRAFISVEDNGSGIKKSDLKNIFMPFFTTRDDGMGIGLSVCRTVVQRHSGRMRVKTSYGKGSVFTLELPIEQKKVNND